MRIFINGRISAKEPEKDAGRFGDAQSLFEGLGFEVVNPARLPKESWKRRMVRAFSLLLDCDAVYMMDDWIGSTAAEIVYDAAVRTGKVLVFETVMRRVDRNAVRIGDAVRQVTGLGIAEFAERSRRSECYLARMLFAHHCNRIGIPLASVAFLIRRDISTLRHIINKYSDEVRYNRTFREMARDMDAILGNNE